MTATLTQVRDALKTRLETISGLHVYAFPPGQVQVPAAVITPADGEFIDYNDSVSTGMLSLTIALFVQRAQERSSTEAIDAYVARSGSSSIYATVEAGCTLGGIVDDCVVTAARNHGTFTYGETQYFGCEFSVEVTW